MAQLLVRSLEALRARCDDLFERLDLAAHDALVLPLAGQRIRALPDLDGFERLFNHQQLVGVMQARDDVRPVIVGMRRTYDYLHIRVDGPQALDRLQTVPAGRHAHIDKGQGVGPALIQGLLHASDAFLTLKRRIYLKAQTNGRRRTLPQQREFSSGELHGIVNIVADDLAKIAVDVAVVVDDEDSPIDRR